MVNISSESATKNPTTAKVKALISKLQEDRKFSHIGNERIEKLKSKGVSLIDQIYNVILRLEIEKDNIISNSNTLVGERKKCDDCISLPRMVI